MRPISTSRSLSAGIVLAALAVVLVACGPGVSGTASPAGGGSVPVQSPGPATTEPTIGISTIPSSELPPSTPEPGTGPADPGPSTTAPADPGPTDRGPDGSSPVVPSPVVPSPVVPGPSATDPAPPVDPEPADVVQVDAELFWSDDVDAYAWSSPSRNLLCLLQPAEQLVACAAFEHTIPAVEGCYPDQPVVAELSPGNVIQGCTGDVPYSGDVLDYGLTISVGTITCSSEQSGMVCDNGDLAFMLSRESLDFAG